ncbi:glucose-1-phosphate adenylyltransferase large subunit, chloroplastic/amyloplastic-like [Asparagus officinalis]|uniref:glucose-1-phosphate adenylyltransferase large subunit, chloroplastic/amyloplastic-like n=1 Tax=Asparagus officinalis TaxID=4686 RepID=UPI00098DF72F|nr:glucose-1-phosphate adenylyltransferase large subunit, chloroplastic/amyloplastic-like [Asparagus officinalis]
MVSQRSLCRQCRIREGTRLSVVNSVAAQSSTVNSVLADVAKDLLTVQAPSVLKPAANPKTIASIILGGGAGTRLFPLTSRRSKPVVSG